MTTPSDTPAPVAVRTIRLVYIGVCILVDLKLGYEYRAVDADGKLGRSRCFRKKLVVCAIGSILDCAAPDENTVGGRTRAGYWHDEGQRAEWEAASRATEADFNERKAQKKMDAESPMFASIEPLRAAYRKLPHPRRRFLLADVIRYITG